MARLVEIITLRIFCPSSMFQPRMRMRGRTPRDSVRSKNCAGAFPVPVGNAALIGGGATLTDICELDGWSLLRAGKPIAWQSRLAKDAILMHDFAHHWIFLPVGPG
jgi:hypothetical protein